MNNMVFTTRGDWDSTTLFNNGAELAATRLSVDMKVARDENGDPVSGGISNGGELVASVLPQGQQQEMGIFPGRLDVNFPGHKLVIENSHPNFAFEFSRVWYNERDVTDHVVEALVEVDSEANVVKAYLMLYKPHWLGSDEVATYNFL